MHNEFSGRTQDFCNSFLSSIKHRLYIIEIIYYRRINVVFSLFYYVLASEEFYYLIYILGHVYRVSGGRLKHFK